MKEDFMDADAVASDGDQACWLHLLCEDCGALVTAHVGHVQSCSSFVANVAREVSTSDATLDVGNAPFLTQH
jgi:hypothetical protein